MSAPSAFWTSRSSSMPMTASPTSTAAWPIAPKAKPDRAIPDYDRAIKLNGNDAVAYESRGLAYPRYPRLRARHSGLRSRRLKIKPDYIPGAERSWHRLCLRKGQVERAIQDFDQAILLDPRDAFAYNNRGLAYRNRGEVDRAIKDYDQALAAQRQLRPGLLQSGAMPTTTSATSTAPSATTTRRSASITAYALAYYDRGVSYFFRSANTTRLWPT